MEEQRARENAQMEGTVSSTQPPRGNGVFGSVLTEEADNAAVQKSTTEGANVENMTEEEQLAHAMRLSLCEPSIHGTLLASKWRRTLSELYRNSAFAVVSRSTLWFCDMWM